MNVSVSASGCSVRNSNLISVTDAVESLWARTVVGHNCSLHPNQLDHNVEFESYLGSVFPDCKRSTIQAPR
ncbi:hypothetical protein PSCLAVI8L_250016 [Pseudoclavibacter sp. 8L]|nr:hypothetical protein PSCLAVI8L_250016 [Pseudoclavibacter sp. 8L]